MRRAPILTALLAAAMVCGSVCLIADRVPELSKPLTDEVGIEQVGIALTEDESAVVVRIVPTTGHFIFGAAEDSGVPVRVTPVEADGVVWGRIDVPRFAKSHDPVVIEVPFVRTTATSVSLRVEWQVCAAAGTCYAPESSKFSVRWVRGR